MNKRYKADLFGRRLVELLIFKRDLVIEERYVEAQAWSGSAMF